MKFKKSLCVLISAGLVMTMGLPCAAEEETAADSAVEAVAESDVEIISGSAVEETAEEITEIPDDITAESLIEGYKKKQEEATSITGEETLDFAMKMAIFGQEMSMKMDMHFDVETAKDVSHMIGNMTMVSEGIPEEENMEESAQTEMYSVREDDDTYTVYSLDTDSGIWSKSSMDFNIDLNNLLKGDSYILGDSTVEVDGKTCYEVKGTMVLAEMLEYLGESADGLNEIFPVGEEDADAYYLDVFYYFDTESKDMISMKMDGAAMMEKLFMDALRKEMEADMADDDSGFDMTELLDLFKIEIPEFVVEVNNIEFGTIESIEIPEEVLAASEVFNPDGWDPEDNDKPGRTDDEITFEGMTVIDNDECKVILEEIDPDDDWGYTIRAELENKTADKALMFSVDNAYVNGVENNPYFGSEVAPGKKAKETIRFDTMEEYGITDFSDIEMSFTVMDRDDWSADYAAEETVHVYPYGEEKAEAFVREPADTDQVLVDDDNFCVILTGVEEDDIWGYTLNFYIVNKTDKNVMINAEDESINGYMASAFFGHYLGAGKSAFTEMSWSDSTLEESGITDVDEIEFTLRAYDEDNWENDDLLDQVITLDM